MSMKVKIFYEENVNLGNYQTAKVHLTLESDKEITDKDQLETVSNTLLDMARGIVKGKLEEIKQERNES